MTNCQYDWCVVTSGVSTVAGVLNGVLNGGMLSHASALGGDLLYL